MDAGGGLDFQTVNFGVEGRGGEVEVAIVGLGLTLARGFAGEEGAEGSGVLANDAGDEAGAFGKGFVGEGLFAAGHGDAVGNLHRGYVDDR